MERVTQNAKVTANLGSVLVKEPKAFPAASLQVFKSVSRRVWHTRGGGLYACGFFLTFIWLEISTILGEILAAEGVGAFFSEQILELLFRFSVMSLKNTISAFMWPIHIISLSPMWGGIFLGVMFVVFEKFLKDPLEHWLFEDEVDSVTAHPRENN